MLVSIGPQVQAATTSPVCYTLSCVGPGPVWLFPDPTSPTWSVPGPKDLLQLWTLFSSKKAEPRPSARAGSTAEFALVSGHSAQNFCLLQVKFSNFFQIFGFSLPLSSTAGGAGGTHGVDCRKGLNSGGCPPARFIPGLPHLQVIFRFALALFKYKEEEVLRLQEPMAIFKYLRYFTRTILDAR